MPDGRIMQHRPESPLLSTGNGGNDGHIHPRDYDIFGFQMDLRVPADEWLLTHQWPGAGERRS